jgi:hypothetical protein
MLRTIMEIRARPSLAFLVGRRLLDRRDAKVKNSAFHPKILPAVRLGGCHKRDRYGNSAFSNARFCCISKAEIHGVYWYSLNPPEQIPGRGEFRGKYADEELIAFGPRKTEAHRREAGKKKYFAKPTKHSGFHLASDPVRVASSASAAVGS